MMQRVVATAAFAGGTDPGERERAVAALGRLHGSHPDLSHSHAGLHLEGSLGAGELTWDLAVADAAALDRLRNGLVEAGWESVFRSAEPDDRAALGQLAGIEAWLVEPVARGGAGGVGVGIKRTNLVRVADVAAAESVERWCRDVVVLADRVPAIRRWSLARTHALTPGEPRVAWTHAWEQEFEVLEGLVEDYMASPYHWGWLDGWYDPEVPFSIVEPDLAHLYCAATESVLAWGGASSQ